MNALARTTAWQGVALFALCCPGVGSTAHAYCRLTTEVPSPGARCEMRGTGLSWDRQCISYSLVERDRGASGNVPFADIRDAADRSFEAWETVQCSAGEQFPIALAQTVELGECRQPEYDTLGPNANTIMFLTEWEGEEFPPDAYGLTLVWHDPKSGKIFDADMQINETIGPLTVCNNICPRGAVDVENVITHEAGHFLGLGHSSVGGSTMSASATLGETAKRSLEDDDRQGVCSIYGGLSRTVCGRDDYAPDQGFHSTCSVGQTTTTCACSAPGARAHSRWFSVLAMGVGLVLTRFVRRHQSRVRKSSSSPRPSSR